MPRETKSGFFIWQAAVGMTIMTLLLSNMLGAMRKNSLLQQRILALLKAPVALYNSECVPEQKVECLSSDKKIKITTPPFAYRAYVYSSGEKRYAAL
jgi:hypothetical protein